MFNDSLWTTKCEEWWHTKSWPITRNTSCTCCNAVQLLSVDLDGTHLLNAFIEVSTHFDNDESEHGHGYQRLLATVTIIRISTHTLQGTWIKKNALRMIHVPWHRILIHKQKQLIWSDELRREKWQKKWDAMRTWSLYTMTVFIFLS